MSTDTPHAVVSRLLRQCCTHAGCHSGVHECDRPDSRPPFAVISEPGTLPTVGPLTPAVQEYVTRIAGPLREGHSVRLLLNGADAFAAMLALIEAARTELLVENFIFRSDAVGNEFADTLRRKARSGVEVRVLHDPVGFLMSRRFPVGFRLYGSGAQVRSFNPPRFSKEFLRFGRDHRKVTVADGRRAVVGGMGLADVWAGNCVRTCTWRDSAVLVDGPVASDMSEAFEELWGRSLSLRPFRWGSSNGSKQNVDSRASGGVPVRVLRDGGRRRVTEPVLVQTISAADSSILITNPYFLPTPALRDALAAAANRGVRVRILMPGENNHPVAGLAAEAGLGPILGAGAEVWLWSGPLIHAKTVVIDGCWSLVGSSNLDPLSLHANCELNLEIHGSSFGEHLEAAFEADVKTSYRLGGEEWSRRSRSRRALGRGASSLRRWL